MKDGRVPTHRAPRPPVFCPAMTGLPAILMHKVLGGNAIASAWPAGVGIVPFDEVRHPAPCHRLLASAYVQGQGEVGQFAQWWAGVRNDREYERRYMFVAEGTAGEPVAFAHCWSGAFLKDFAIAAEWRRRGLGTALLAHVFEAFRSDGHEALRLKVRPDNRAAIAFYESMGMVPSPDA